MPCESPNALFFAPTTNHKATVLIAKLRSLPLFALLLVSTLPLCQSSNANPVTCEFSTSDSDGDGWGWENNKSCKVVANTAASSSNSAQVVNCTSSSSDPDGDGWGWENNRSCKVSANSSSATDSSSNSSTQTTVVICNSAGSDPDGDGWGWENNRSCKIAASSTTTPAQNPAPAETPAPVEAPAPAPAPTPARQYKVMPVGDSISHGVSLEKTTSYRKPLATLLNNAGCRFEYVGSQRNNYNHSTFVSPHEAYYGHSADHFLTGFNDRAGNNRGIAHSMATFNPDVVLLHIGSNDARQGQNTADIVAEIDQIIAAVFNKNSSAKVLVANIIPWYRSERAQVRRLGIAIEGYVAQLSNPAVTLVDVWTGYRSSYMLSDNIHPNAAGDNHIAKAFFKSYQAAGLCAQ